MFGFEAVFCAWEAAVASTNMPAKINRFISGPQLWFRYGRIRRAVERIESLAARCPADGLNFPAMLEEQPTHEHCV
jgi:hypothetical protein